MAEGKEIKLVINFRLATSPDQKTVKAVIGVSSPGCDPVMAVVDGDIEMVMDSAVGLLDRAKEQWAVSPKNPKSETPAPAAPAPAAPRTTLAAPVKATGKTVPEKPKEGGMKSMF